MNFDEEIYPDDVASIESGLKEFQSQKITFHSVNRVKGILKRVWDYGLDDIWVRIELEPPTGPVKYSIKYKLREAPTLDSSQHVVKQRTKQETGSWFLGMSKEFLNAIEKLDRNIQGRILQAIGYIVGDPLTLKGDTVKPLKGPEGLWRYRIGDYRLVYHPDINNRRVVLIAFAARGSAYN